MPEIELHDGNLPHPISALENYFQTGGVSLIQAAFAHSYFIDPESVRQKVVYFPNRARRSREHYPGLDKGKRALWSGNGREVVLGLQPAGSDGLGTLYRSTSGKRDWLFRSPHLGAPVGPGRLYGRVESMLHAVLGRNANGRANPHEELEQAIRQASWDLYFRENSVCDPPGFVKNPGCDLDSLLADQPILVLQRNHRIKVRRPNQLVLMETSTILSGKFGGGPTKAGPTFGKQHAVSRVWITSPSGPGTWRTQLSRVSGKLTGRPS